MLVVTNTRDATSAPPPDSATVEPPLKPNQQNHRIKHAESAERQGVTRELHEPCRPWSYLPIRGPRMLGADQSGNTADHMYRRGACEIMEAKLCEPAAAPDPVTGNRVNNRRDNHRVNAVCRELGALCHGTGNDGRSSCTEYGLEDQGRPVVSAHRQSPSAKKSKPPKNGLCRAEHDAEAEEPEDRRADARSPSGSSS